MAITTRYGRSPACLSWLHRTAHHLDGGCTYFHRRPQYIAIRQSSARETRHPFILRPSLEQISLQLLLQGAYLAYIIYIHGALRSDRTETSDSYSVDNVTSQRHHTLLWRSGVRIGWL
jgi:hypothetical protein